ncbi:hypothetical protein [Lutibacter maritimus]|uniref:Uncharacterized protein n=1 Tax=Lutibacter maritimus TaxID=593133 RepID=A0A1I6NPA0_9FLAO|nr:hypothetical protein [Lutibacter maritimus]SFS29735.1 hypothetical protein SAMN04488006_0264 [Lutibacter maritimus]
MKIFLFFVFVTVSVYSTGIEEIRNNFLTVKTIKEADNYIQLLEKSDLKEANAYKAALLLMKAKFAFFPFNKWSYFKEGSELLDNAIKTDAKNIEMRYIRFLFQSEIPKFLGYHKNIEEDYTFIVNNIVNSSLPLKFKQTMLGKMLLVKGLTVSQSTKINKVIQKL